MTSHAALIFELRGLWLNDPMVKICHEKIRKKTKTNHFTTTRVQYMTRSTGWDHNCGCFQTGVYQTAKCNIRWAPFPPRPYCSNWSFYGAIRTTKLSAPASQTDVLVGFYWISVNDAFLSLNISNTSGTYQRSIIWELLMSSKHTPIARLPLPWKPQGRPR